MRVTVLLDVGNQSPAFPDPAAPAELGGRASKRQVKERDSDGHDEQIEGTTQSGRSSTSSLILIG